MILNIKAVFYLFSVAADLSERHLFRKLAVSVGMWRCDEIPQESHFQFETVYLSSFLMWSCWNP